MTTALHIDDLRRRAIEVLLEVLDTDESVEKAVLGQDPFGLVRVILWLRPGADEQAVRARLMSELQSPGRFCAEDIWIRTDVTSHADNLVCDAAWDEGLPVPRVDRLRIDERVRSRTAWLPHFREPPWEAQLAWRRETTDTEAPTSGPPIVVFYSFKGGVGRTTALATFAIQRAKQGERVFVLDMDLDAPGAGILLPGDTGIAPHGAVDYLLEAPLPGEVNPERYVHRCLRERMVVGKPKEPGGAPPQGEIIVMPAGKVDEGYLGKLSRLDLEVRGDEHPLRSLLLRAKDAFLPDWILIDARAGLSPAAGLLLDGTAHLHVLFGTTSAQSQLGLTQVLRRLGEERVRRGLAQGSCLVVQAMIPQSVDVERAARRQFDGWLEPTLRQHYVAAAEEDAEGKRWTVHDLEGEDAPSRAVGITYNPTLAFFSRIEDVLTDLEGGRYLELGARIIGQFELPEPEDDLAPYL